MFNLKWLRQKGASAISIYKCEQNSIMKSIGGKELHSRESGEAAGKHKHKNTNYNYTNNGASPENQFRVLPV